ncbi:MAG: MGMT family protein [Haloferacaceae archaeon]
MDEAGIYARESPQLDRIVQVGIAAGRVISASFPDEMPADAGTDHPILDRLFDYLDGGPDVTDVEVALTMPTDRRRVLETVRSVPYGRTASLEEVARMTDLDPDDPDDLGLARTALSANPVPMFVPDHRVEGAAGATPADVAERLRNLED